MPIDILTRRLQNQRLIRASTGDVTQIVARLGAVQAQDFNGAKWALGLRDWSLTDASVGRAFDEGRILRTHVLRPTWHFVSPDDIRWMLALTAPRIFALSAFYHRRLELEPRTFSRSHAVFERSLSGGQQLTRAELAAALKRAGITAAGPRLAYLMMHAELSQVVCSGARRGNQFTYALLAERVPRARALKHDEALALLVDRYFSSHGPATLRDFAWWSGLTIADARRGLDLLGSKASRANLGEREYWGTAPQRSPRPRGITAWLLPNYDEFLIAYKDRELVTPATPAAKDTYQHHVILNRRLAGSWRPVRTRQSLTLQVQLYARPTTDSRRALEAAANRYATFAGRAVDLDIMARV